MVFQQFDRADQAQARQGAELPALVLSQAGDVRRHHDLPRALDGPVTRGLCADQLQSVLRSMHGLGWPSARMLGGEMEITSANGAAGPLIRGIFLLSQCRRAPVLAAQDVARPGLSASQILPPRRSTPPAPQRRRRRASAPPRVPGARVHVFGTGTPRSTRDGARGRQRPSPRTAADWERHRPRVVLDPVDLEDDPRPLREQEREVHAAAPS